MTGLELKQALKILGWSQKKLAVRIATAPSTVTRWVGEKTKAIPGPVAAYVRLAMRVQATWKDVDKDERDA